MTPIKLVWTALGTCFVGLGIAGIVLPLVPATPFFLLASICYVRGSDRLHDWLMNHRLFGPYIRNFREKRGMPIRAKIASIGLLWGSVISSIMTVDIPVVTVAMPVVGVGVTALILRIPTFRQQEDAT